MARVLGENHMDIKHLKNLVALMVENDLTRLELEEGETHILLKRGQAPVVNDMPLPAPVQAAPAPGPAPEAAVTPPQDKPDLRDLTIRSPMVGTFYESSDPDTPAFIKIGDIVEPDTVVCLVEAMKVFNEIKAEVSGRLTRVLVNNADAVEYDQPLFAVEPV